MPTISKDIWITREGQQIEIRKMASSHLLSTIHFIERNRFTNVTEIAHDHELMGRDTAMEAANYYAQWPIQYDTLVQEAQRRNLIIRQSPTKESDNANNERRQLR